MHIMAETHNKILLLTLVHPDFLPPVYAIAQVLRDEGYAIHILTFDSFVPADLNIGNNIVIESAGRHHNRGLMQRLHIRRKFKARARQLALEQPKAIMAFCAFSYLCALEVKKKTPVIYHAIEVADFIPRLFMRSPLSHLNNLLALRSIHKADLAATPSVQRSAWLAGRQHLDFMPYTILNTAYLGPQETGQRDIFRKIVPEVLHYKKIVLYTGAVNAHLCILELVTAFGLVNDPDSALLITGIKENTYCNEVKDAVERSPAKDRIKLYPYLTRAEMLALQTNADIGVCLAREYEDNVESKMMAPNKVGEYLARGLYVLGVNSEYMLPLKIKGIASLSASTTPADISPALQNALLAVTDKGYKTTINDFVRDYFCMQQQLKPVLAFLNDKGGK